MKFLLVASFLLGYCGSVYISKKVEGSYPRVITPLGTIEGFYDISKGGRLYEAYRGIPYAHPPIGFSRFQVAKSVSPWTGILMAKEFGSPCMQYNFILRRPGNKASGSEDCLYLNIYSPVVNDGRRKVDEKPAGLLPVIFFIPGGAFLTGNGDRYGPKYLLDRNVTLVTFNYRVGPLGFLSTEDDIVPGNMGLKDQVIALRWVKDNIRYFGGDPSRITIFGHSAGGASVHYHYLTNLTAGLFQGGMSLSGTALNPWALIRNPLEKAKKLGTVVGCPTENTWSMVDCLRARPAHQIVNAVGQFMEFAYNPPNGWGPSVEKGGGEFTFIDRPPIDIIASGEAHDVPWITGVVDAEFLTAAAHYIANEEFLESLNDGWEKIAPSILHYKDTVPKIDQPIVARLIKRYYLGKSPICRTTFNRTVQMLGDRVFVEGLETAAKSQSLGKKSPVYVYYFSYRGAHSVSEMLSGTSENFGVCHGDDLAYVLDSSFDPTTTVADREIQEMLIDLWVSFATDGTPDVGVKWPRMSQSLMDEYSYLHIAGPKDIGMKNASNFGEKNFWRSLDL